MVFEGVTAEAGGGKLVLGGTVTYGEGPLRYDLNLQATRVRVRYPLGTHWLSDGTLRLAGTLQGGLLSGRVQVHRAFLGEGFDMAGLMVASSSGPAKGPATTSEYLRHLQFDISAVTAPGALLEISAGRFEAEASLRVRGTGERPVFLGNIHLISGEMRFRGNRYQLTRGDINFQNPLEFNPNLDIEATTSVQQYDVTVNFSGKASKLTLSYRSDPPLPPNDIITLLALGRTTEETELRSGSGAAGSAGANALLSEAISSQLGGRIERLFGISRFRFDPIVGASSGTSTSAQSLGRITIEQQVQRDLVITYSTDVNSTEQQVIQVEYNVNRGVSILGLRDKNGTFALEVKFKKRFK
jgi:translocation and assembly module TamB